MELLISSKLIVPVQGGRFLLSQVLSKHMRIGKTNRCVNFPEEWEGLSDPVIYKKIMDLCEIELRRKNSSGDYYIVRTTTKEGISTLKHILRSPDVDFNKFVATTREAYRSNARLPGFANYLTNNLWEEMYESGAQSDAGRQRDRKGIV